jgi:hypothetical protein
MFAKLKPNNRLKWDVLAENGALLLFIMDWVRTGLDAVENREMSTIARMQIQISLPSRPQDIHYIEGAFLTSEEAGQVFNTELETC